VPGRSDGEEEESTGQWSESAPVAEFSGEGEEEYGGGEEEDESNDALGEDGEGECGPHEVRVETGFVFERLQEAVEGCGEEKGEEDVWEEDSGEEEDTGGGEDSKAGVEGGSFTEGLARPADAKQH